MPQSNTIYANFETVDLAEVAARQLKEHIKDIKSITIRYKNIPRSNAYQNKENSYSEMLNRDFSLTMGINQGYGTATNNGTSLSVSPIPSFLLNNRILAEHDMKEQDRYPEIEQTTESRLIIKAPAEETARIEQRLRGIGAQKISHT